MIPNAEIEQRPGGRKKRPVDQLAISIINEHRLVAKLPIDSPRRTPTLPKINFNGEER